MPTNLVNSNPTDASRRAQSVRAFVKVLRWITALYAVATVAATVVLAVLAPNCIAIGVSILKGQDCTNRETYYLILAAGAGVNIGFSILMFMGAYALELLGVVAFGPPDDATGGRRLDR